MTVANVPLAILMAFGRRPRDILDPLGASSGNGDASPCSVSRQRSTLLQPHTPAVLATAASHDVLSGSNSTRRVWQRLRQCPKASSFVAIAGAAGASTVPFPPVLRWRSGLRS